MINTTTEQIEYKNSVIEIVEIKIYIISDFELTKPQKKDNFSIFYSNIYALIDGIYFTCGGIKMAEAKGKSKEQLIAETKAIVDKKYYEVDVY